MKVSNKILLFVIILVGVILRLWNFVEIPYSHDEFSALFRTNYSSFSDLINLGVKPDGHPAGIQVFLYYWTSWFGKVEWVVKLPFAIMGICSIPLIYKIAKLWYNESVGLISAAFLASLQYMVVYSVTARPYISGMFFVLGMVWFWTKMIKDGDSKFWKNGVMYLLFASLSAYNHHFSLLFAALVGFTGILLIPRKYLVSYILLGVFIFILYLPHLSIFLHQLSNKGVEGWLAKPDNDWLWTYLKYIFHFSPILLIAAIALMLFGLREVKNRIHIFKPSLMFLIWFLVPFIIGFWYSREVNAVLQYSVLIFSFPFLLFVLFGHFKELKPLANMIVVSVILISCTVSLLFERKHYDHFYKGYYNYIVTDAAKAYNQGVEAILIDSHKEISNYYLNKHNLKLPIIWVDSFSSELEFRDFVKKISSNGVNSLYLGAWASSNSNFLSIIEEYFPFQQTSQDYYGGSSRILSHTDGDSISSVMSTLDFTEDRHPDWSNIIEGHILRDVRPVYRLDSSTEWSPNYSALLSSLTSNSNDIITISARVKPIHSVENISLVSVIEDDGEVIHWSNVEFSRFVKDSSSDWHVIHQGISLANVPITKSSVFKTFVWNKDMGSYLLDDFEVKVRRGNPIQYGLIEEY